MSYAGEYDFIINTKLESDSYFYNDILSNDTLSATVSVLGMPRYNPFPDMIGDNPIDTFLVAGKNFDSYEWGNPDYVMKQAIIWRLWKYLKSPPNLLKKNKK